MIIPINFQVVGRNESWTRRNCIYLQEDNWDDYSFKTTFYAIYVKADGRRLDLGTVKIGYVGQPHGWTREAIPKIFPFLPENWFSLGQDVEYYIKIRDSLSHEEADHILRCLRDVVVDKSRIKQFETEQVFRDSITRSVSLSHIYGQFVRVLAGDAALTKFRFVYRDPGDERNAPVDLSFFVEPESTPSTNLHVLIGRNGVGKTTLLNNMVRAIVMPSDENRGSFFEISDWGAQSKLAPDYFSSVVSVSFSAFDPFVPPADRPDRSKGVAYYYVGMKKRDKSNPLHPANLNPPQPLSKSNDDLANDLVDTLDACLSQPAKARRWKAAIERLASDENFADMELGRLLGADRAQGLALARNLVSRMSSGHSIVLLTITKLVETVEEKTLVLIDEPESHLHPPLLAAFTRALSDLLYSRNGVAIIATHSPVVAQEVPRRCVWKMTRIRTEGRVDRPERETFGENVGVLTREIFGLEVSQSGFHEILSRAVDAGGSFESIMSDFKGQLGNEAQALVRARISSKA